MWQAVSLVTASEVLHADALHSDPLNQAADSLRMKANKLPTASSAAVTVDVKQYSARSESLR